MTLDEAIKKFGAQFSFLQDPDEAHSKCDIISKKFIRFLAENGVVEGRRAFLVYYTCYTSRHYPLKVRWENPHRPWAVAGGVYYHVVVKIGRLRIDWTARQFNKKAKFPLIWKTRT